MSRAVRVGFAGCVGFSSIPSSVPLQRNVKRPIRGWMSRRSPLAVATRSRTRAIRLELIEDSPEYALLVTHLLREELGEEAVVDHCDSISAAKGALVEEGLACILLDLSLPDA